MNLLGMKRKLLPYGMPLGGGAALGAMGSPSPSSGGGKSAAAPQNSYSPSFGGQSAAPTSAAPSSGGKSSGLGQGGYGMAPSLQQSTAQTQPSFGQSPFQQTPFNSSVNSTTQQDMMGGNRGGGQGFGQVMQGMGGGKSSGLGQGGYGGAPSFDGMPTQGGFNQGFNQAENSNMGSGLRGFNGTFSPEADAFQRANPQPQQPTSQMEDMVRMMSTGSDRGTDPAVANQMMSQLSGMRENFMRNPPQQMSSDQFRQSGGFNQPSQFGRFNQPSQGNFGGQLMGFGGPQSSQMRSQQSNFSSTDMTQDAQRQRQMQQQPSFGGQMGAAATQRQMQGGFGPQAPTQDAYNAFKVMTGSPMSFDEYSQNATRKFQQPQQQFNPYQQQQFNPFQQQFGGFQQQPQFQQPQNISGLQGLFNQMRGQQQMQQRPMQQMPQYRSPALQFRPNMQNAQSVLSRVSPSVQKQQADAAQADAAQAARIAELEAQIAAFQPQTPTDYGNNGG